MIQVTLEHLYQHFLLLFTLLSLCFSFFFLIHPFSHSILSPLVIGSHASLGYQMEFKWVQMDSFESC